MREKPDKESWTKMKKQTPNRKAMTQTKNSCSFLYFQFFVILNLLSTNISQNMSETF